VSTTATARRIRTRVGAAVAVAGVAAVLLSACAGGGNGGATPPAKLTYLKNTENTTIEPVLKDLEQNACSAEQKAMPIDISSTPQETIDSKVSTLASQNALPVAFAAGGNPAEGAKLAKAGKLVDFEKAFQELGVSDDVAPGAVSTIKKLYGGGFDFLPFQYNIEGIFYNKQIFEKEGITPPKTWDELMADADKLQAAGIQPFSASGQQGWPLTRLVSGYIFRDLGPDALQKVADGKAKLTDPEYVKAAQAIADMGKKGYFGQDVASLDYDGATNQFLTGKSAMEYMGSWLLANINDPKQNQIGADNVGFMPFPAVSGGKGSIDQYPSNVGLPQTFNAKYYAKDNNVGKWVKCIAENFGTAALKQGQITGFVAKDKVDGLSPITQTVSDTINTNKAESVLWFEALFNSKASNDSSKNAALLVTGQTSAKDFMSLVQTDLDNG
jgi:raffinose/stachyose/melibiose transport system substrate-binding protein